MAGIYNPWANPETDETLTGMFATPDLMATGNPLAGGLDHEPLDEADDELEDASDPMEDMEPEDVEEPKPMIEALAVIQQQSDIIKMLLEKLKA